MTPLLALALFLQTVWPQPQQWTYTSADPIDPAVLGLATQEGRYSFYALDQCRWLVPGINVAFYSTEDYSVQWVTLTDEDDAEVCRIQLMRRMSDVPCFTFDGTCDVAAEADE